MATSREQLPNKIDALPTDEFDDIPAARRMKSPFASLREWGDWVNANCAPARDDDTCVLMGQTGPRKRATHDELIAIVNEQRARYGWPPYDPSNPVSKLAYVSDESTATIVEQWQNAGPALAEIRRSELRQLDDQQALAAACQLLELLPLVPANDTTTGLLEQQRLFTRSRE